MTAVKEVEIRCGLCTNCFPPPLPVTDMAGLDALARWDGNVDCPHCHRIVEVSQASLSFVLDDGSETHFWMLKDTTMGRLGERDYMRGFQRQTNVRVRRRDREWVRFTLFFGVLALAWQAWQLLSK